MTLYYVAVVEHDTEKTVKTYNAMSERNAEKLDRGINLNLDDRFYYTEIRPAPAHSE